ncbi:MAG: sugar transporter [Bacteroides sp.]|nr:sugar transporter [Bacteroides sp.]
MADRVHKSLLNAKVNLIFYFLSLFFSFFSRKIFLDCLGAEFIGLTGTLGNILGYLNLAELGVGAAISIFLYKPLQIQNHEGICEIVSVFGYIYQKIGKFILVSGIIVSLFFPCIFGNSNLGLGIIYFSFFSFLGSSLIGYFINYRQILLTADQKNYLVAIYFQSAGLVKTALQIFLAYTYKNLFVWVAIEFFFGIIGCIVLNRKINKEYPWLKSNVRNGKALLKKYPTIITNTKQVFIHKIKDFLLSKSDELFIFAFVSLKMVAYYGNYTMIINKVSQLFVYVLDGVGPGVGNLVAEGNKNNMMKVFWELMAIRHFIAGLLFISPYYLIESFISLWLGPDYILDQSILILLLIYIYMMQSRGVVDTFIYAHGLYADTWSAWTELVLNVSITLIVGYYYGIIGILLGKIISIFLIVVFWKPFYLFTSGFKLSISVYWTGTIKYYLIFGVSFLLINQLNGVYSLVLSNSWLSFIGYAIIIVISYLIINLTLLYFFAPGIKEIILRIKNLKCENKL